MSTMGSSHRWLDLISRWFGRKTSASDSSSSGDEPRPEPLATVLKPRVLLIIYNPVVQAGPDRRLIETMGWRDPEQLALTYAADIRECSHGLVSYQIVDRVVAGEIPVKLDKFQYDPREYVEHMRSGTGFHDADPVDYEAILDKFRLVERIANNELDEVWIFGGPYFGFYESSMAGPGAFWCNGPVVPNSDRAARRFVIMGFNYERGVGEMLEDLGHRAESVLARQFGSEAALDRAYAPNRLPVSGDAPANLFERFIRYDRIAPGQANVGVMHYAPNSLRDYDWGNPTPVSSCCDDWLEFPDLADPPVFRHVTARDWGDGDIRTHHKWWLTRLPHALGATGGVLNNWWLYVVDVNRAR